MKASECDHLACATENGKRETVRLHVSLIFLLAQRLNEIQKKETKNKNMRMKSVFFSLLLQLKQHIYGIVLYLCVVRVCGKTEQLFKRDGAKHKQHRGCLSCCYRRQQVKKRRTEKSEKLKHHCAL